MAHEGTLISFGFLQCFVYIVLLGAGAGVAVHVPVSDAETAAPHSPALTSDDVI